MCDLNIRTSKGQEKRATRQAAIIRLVLVLVIASPTPIWAQSTGQIIGRVVDSETREPIAAAEVGLAGAEARTLTSERGDFALTALPTGEVTLQVQRLGYRTATLTVLVRAGRTNQVTVRLTPTPLEVAGVAAEVERVRLIEPEVTVSHTVTLGRDVKELPVDVVEEVVELTTGVSDGHFRGGRIGQETYLIDGLEVKNQFGGSTNGQALEVSPYALEEIEVVTGGTRPAYGSALSGSVSYVTRRGNPDRWEGRAAVSSDSWLPDDVYRGFSSLGLTVDGPLAFLGSSTLFADILAQGMIDADPRARGLTCLEPEDSDAELADAISSLASDPATRHLYCPYSAARLPYQRGDRLIGFLRFDQPLSTSANLTLSFLYNRRQAELFTPTFKYNPDFQQGQRTKGYLTTLTLDWARNEIGRSYRVTARAAGLRLDRHLGALDPWTFDGRARVAGFGLQDFRFLGEEFIRQPIERQLESGAAVPGYLQPRGTIGSPFGPAAEGIFFTEGTPDLAAWNRTDFIGGDLQGSVLTTRGDALRAGGSLRFYRVENYERVLAYLPGSSPSYARFYPTTANGWLELSLLAADNITAQLGLRYEGFKSGLVFQQDRADVLSPVIDTRWRSLLMPRLGVAIPVPKTNDRTMFWFNYGKIAQPPDFRFFLDSTIGDSLRADIRRQGNPSLAFEEGSAYELGLRHLLTDELAITFVAFTKELTSLVTSSLSFANTAANQFTTGDFGSVRGLELTLRGRWPAVRARAGYALLEARGVTSSPFEQLDPELADQRLEFPLAFDRRHTIDLALLAGQAAGATNWRLGMALTGAIRSGYPLDRRLTVETLPGDPVIGSQRLPWTGFADLRLSYELGSLGLCDHCGWRVLLDIRNVTNRDNVVALRRDTGSLAPRLGDLESVAVERSSGFEPIPLESPRYSELTDLDRNGVITLSEFERTRFAAALDASDPSLYFGESLQVRFGMEFAF